MAFESEFLLNSLGNVFDRLPESDRRALLAIYEVWLKSLGDQLFKLAQTDLAKSLFRVPVAFLRESVAFSFNEDTRIQDKVVVEAGGAVTIEEFIVTDLDAAAVMYWIDIRTDPADFSQTRVRLYSNQKDAIAGINQLGESFSPGFGVKTREPIAGFGGAPATLTLKQSVRIATTQIVSLEGTTPVYNNVGGVSGRGQITWTAGPVSIDGVALADGDRLLLKNEGDGGGLGGDANGIWVRTGVDTWDRAADFDEDAEVLTDTFVSVTEGTANALATFQLTTAGPIQIGGVGGTALTFTAFVGAVISYTYSGAPRTGARIRRFPDRFAYVIDAEIESIPLLYPGTDVDADVARGTPATEGVDYVVVLGGTIVYLVEPPEFNYAPELTQNRRLVFDNFGFLIDFEQSNSLVYRRNVQGLWFAFWNGPTVANIELGAAIVLGFPISSGGTVVEIVDELGGAKTIKVRNLNGIIEESFVRAEFVPFIRVEVGFSSNGFFPLVVPFEVLDYIIDPDIEDRLSFPGVQKVNQWFVLFDDDLWVPYIEDIIAAGETVNLDAVGNFISRIKPVYTRGLLVTLKEFLDQISMATSLDEDQTIVQGEARLNQNWVNWLHFATFQALNGETLASYIGGSRPDWDLDTDVISLVEHVTISDLPIDGGALIYEEPPP